MENLVMKENHPLAIYGGIFVIMMNTMMINQEEERKKSFQQSLKERYEAGDPEVDLLGEPSGKFDYYVFYPGPKNRNPSLLLLHAKNPSLNKILNMSPNLH